MPRVVLPGLYARGVCLWLYTWGCMPGVVCPGLYAQGCTPGIVCLGLYARIVCLFQIFFIILTLCLQIILN